MKNFTTIDEYIAAQPEEKKSVLQQIRNIIKKAAPEAEEVISYGMPAFKYYGLLVFFAAFKEHYGFYPVPKTIAFFKDKLTAYKTSKGAIQFPVNKPIPEKLITEMVKYRVEKNLADKRLKDSAKNKTTATKRSVKK